MEQWKDICEYEKLYQVSNLGRIKSLPRNTAKGKILSPNKSTSYYRICLVKDGFVKSYAVHRLVATAFIKNKRGKAYVNHKDGNRQNNCVDNLEWVTPSENNLHAFKNGFSKARRGENHPLAKLSEKQVIEIRAMQGKYTIKYLAKMFGVSYQQISDIITRKKWKHI